MGARSRAPGRRARHDERAGGRVRRHRRSAPLEPGLRAGDGLSQAQARERSLHELFVDGGEADRAVRLVMGGGGPSEHDLALRACSGGPRAVRWTFTELADPDGAGWVVATGIDLTALHAAEAAGRESEARFERLFHGSPGGMAIVALDGRYLDVNDALCALTGYTRDELLATTVTALTHADDVGTTRALVETLRGGTPTMTVEKRYVCKDGSVLWVLVAASLLRDDGTTPTCYLAQIHDLTERHAFEVGLARKTRELTRLALRDPLTGLANRGTLLRRLDHAMRQHPLDGRRLGLLFVDLDDFKLVNDLYGHDAGDRVLVEVAARLSTAVRPGDTVARIGGDEFVVLCEHVADMQQADHIAHRIRQVLSDPFVVDDVTLSVAASIGAAVTEPDRSTTAESLLRDADRAMYRSKAYGNVQPGTAAP